MLTAENLTFRRGDRALVDGLGLRIGAGEFVGIVGPNGAGKSTLLRLLAGLLVPAGGQVLLKDCPLARWSRRDRARQMAYLPQSPASSWSLTAAELVALGREPHRAVMAGLSAADRAAIDRAASQCDIAGLMDRDVQTLSGGEAMRVHLARALATEAPVLLADEPIAGLDPQHQLSLLALLSRLARHGRSVVAVLHDLTLAGRFCDRLVMFDRGRLAAAGPPAEVLSDAALAAIFGVTVRRQLDAAEGLVLPWGVAEDGKRTGDDR